jgi:hypothetical protein
MIKLSITAALVLATVGLASAQQRPESYNPGRQPAAPAAAPATQPQAPQRDYRAEAMRRIAQIRDAKMKCYADAGLERGVHFRLNPADDTDIQIYSSVWTRFDKSVHAEMAKCKALGN